MSTRGGNQGISSSTSLTTSSGDRKNSSRRQVTINCVMNPTNLSECEKNPSNRDGNHSSKRNQQAAKAAPISPSPEPLQDENESEVDPVVKNVLVAVNGEGSKNELHNSETKVKRKRSANRSTNTDDFVAPGSSQEDYPSTPATGRTKNDLNATPELNVPLPSLSTVKKKRSTASSDDIDTANTPRGRVTRSFHKPKKTFLASLSLSSPNSVSHPEAQFYKLNFQKQKNELIAKLLKIYNTEIFGSQLPEDLKISWNHKMRGCSGYCYHRRKVLGGVTLSRNARIELSSKIVDRADRLRDTLLHELCHAASWIVDGERCDHGPFWLKWVEKAQNRFPEIPPVTCRHSYNIVSKYIYRCTGCGYTIKRHSKSIDVRKKCCGHCQKSFEILVNKKKPGKNEEPIYKAKPIQTPTGFALFVQENYNIVRQTEKGKKHGEIMKILSSKWAACDKVLVNTPGKRHSGKKHR